MAGARLVTREDALAEFSALSGFADVLASLDENPLPNLVLVTPAVGAGAAELLSDAAALKSKMAAACNAEGRDPATIRHSFLLFDADARQSGGRLFYWNSPGAFEDLAGRLFDMGFDEIGAYYAVDSQRDAMEAAAVDVFPGLRA